MAPNSPRRCWGRLPHQQRLDLANHRADFKWRRQKKDDIANFHPGNGHLGGVSTSNGTTFDTTLWGRLLHQLRLDHADRPATFQRRMAWDDVASLPPRQRHLVDEHFQRGEVHNPRSASTSIPTAAGKTQLSGDYNGDGKERSRQLPPLKRLVVDSGVSNGSTMPTYLWGAVRRRQRQDVRRDEGDDTLYGGYGDDNSGLAGKRQRTYIVGQGRQTMTCGGGFALSTVLTYAVDHDSHLRAAMATIPSHGGGDGRLAVWRSWQRHHLWRCRPTTSSSAEPTNDSLYGGGRARSRLRGKPGQRRASSAAGGDGKDTLVGGHGEGIAFCNPSTTSTSTSSMKISSAISAAEDARITFRRGRRGLERQRNRTDRRGGSVFCTTRPTTNTLLENARRPAVNGSWKSPRVSSIATSNPGTVLAR